MGRERKRGAEGGLLGADLRIRSDVIAGEKLNSPVLWERRLIYLVTAHKGRPLWPRLNACEWDGAYAACRRRCPHLFSPGRCSQEGGGEAGKDGAAEAPPPPGSRVRRGHSNRRAVGAPRAGLALGARVSLATALQSPGRRRVIDGPPGTGDRCPRPPGWGASRRARPGAGRPRRPSSPSSIVLVTGLLRPGPSLMQVTRRCVQESGAGGTRRFHRALADPTGSAHSSPSGRRGPPLEPAPPLPRPRGARRDTDTGPTGSGGRPPAGPSQPGPAPASRDATASRKPSGALQCRVGGTAAPP